MRSGFALEDAYADLEGLDADLGRLLPSRFTPEFGYLTSCPTHAGTGLGRASLSLARPGFDEEVGKVLQGLAQVGPHLPGFYGEGSAGRRELLSVVQPDDPGQDGGRVARSLGKIVRQVIEYEEQARAVLLRTAPTRWRIRPGGHTGA